MSRPPRPQFLARDSYRVRRLMDAARFLPVFGFVLLLLPLMRHSSDTEAPPTASEGVYLFLVWFGLVLAAFLMSLGLRRALDSSKERITPPED
ncbi:hypothetical protein [Natronohydrobacter thiooxidans]|jgi:hypothetical protein|uniref:hypothetical protein n=1 Tax=Natronohydrobacter thiooxidans TaxID=87172 RepID=UPI0008FF4CEF|nr:hypothetical protein [Natronohydrobacter thiooxidans]